MTRGHWTLQGRMTGGSLEGWVTHPYDMGSHFFSMKINAWIVKVHALMWYMHPQKINYNGCWRELWHRFSLFSCETLCMNQSGSMWYMHPHELNPKEWIQFLKQKERSKSTHSETVTLWQGSGSVRHQTGSISSHFSPSLPDRLTRDGHEYHYGVAIATG